jgi:mRNA-degrading endonuclease RelE of RelBE toxin-antitoxin system
VIGLRRNYCVYQTLPKHLSDDEYGLFQKYLAQHPDAGDLIRGSGGCRKVRWAAGGKGKSGGVRVVYYWMGSKDHIYLLVIYGKSEQENLSPADLKRVKVLLEEIENG